MENLLDLQKTFIFYLMATVPTTGEMALALKYDRDKQRIMNDNYDQRLDFRPDVLEMAAKHAGISVQKYLERQRDTFRKQDLKKLNEDYGISEDPDSDSAKIKNLERLKSLADQLQGGTNNLTKIRDIFLKKDNEHDGQ